MSDPIVLMGHASYKIEGSDRWGWIAWTPEREAFGIAGSEKEAWEIGEFAILPMRIVPNGAG